MKKANLNCGSCMYLERDRIFEKSCNELGKLPSAKCCSSYTPDVFTLAGSEQRVERLGKVASAIRGMSLTEIQALAAVLHAEKVTRKAGWCFYQRVVIRFTGSSSSNYFSNFAVGHVVYADKEVVRIVGPSGKMLITAMNVKGGDTVYTLEQFRVIAKEMTRKKNFTDLSNSYGGATVSSRVHNLDDALGSDARIGKKLTVSKTRTDDLVAIISKMSRGFSVKKPARKVSETRSSGSRTLVMDGR